MEDSLTGVKQMAGLFSKVRTIALSNIHTVLDATINLNSVGAVEQHIRDLENARQDLEGSLAEARYDIKTKANNLETHTRQAQELTNNIKLLMGSNGGTPSDEQKLAARKLAESLATLREQITSEKQLLDDANTTASNLTDAVQRVNNKENQMKSQLGTLRGQVAVSQAKEKAANAIDAVSNAVEAGGSIDSITDKIGRDEARASAKFDRALESLAPDPVASAKADAILAELTQK